MKFKLIALILTLALSVSLAACSSDGKQADNTSSEVENSDSSKHELYIRDDFSDEVSARFFSTQSDAEETVKAELIAEGEDCKTFKCSADTEKYDRVVVISGGDESIELAFNEFVSGWHISPFGAEPFVYDKPEPENHEIFSKEFKYKDGDDTKSVYVWTPSDYDKSKKYSVIYMPDGQNLFERSATSYGCWDVCESIEAYMSLGGEGTIVVGIDDSTPNRDSELTPDIGAEVTNPGYEDGKGKVYSDFVVNTVMPFVEKNYSVYTDRAHTAICGSSSGGIESFYIGIEHADRFGFIGALSPAFGLYDNDGWTKYLASKDFSANAPFIYIYCGKADDLEAWLYPGAESMPSNFKSDFPAENIVFRAYEKGLHNESYWRAVFPEVLKFFNSAK